MGRAKLFLKREGLTLKAAEKNETCAPECMLTHVIYFESPVPFKTEFNLLSRNDTRNDLTAVQSVLCRNSISLNMRFVFVMSCFRD